MASALKKKASSTLLVISVLLLLNTSVASMQNIVGGQNQTSINGFFWPESNNEDQVAGLEALDPPKYLTNNALKPDLPAHPSPKPGLPYTRGCSIIYGCRSRIYGAGF